LELINVDRFPGGLRFLGLGQLPAEALRLLWKTRRPATAPQLALGLAAWRALAPQSHARSPRSCAGARRTYRYSASTAIATCSSCPLYATACHLLSNSSCSGCPKGPREVVKLLGWLTFFGDPLPSTTDLQGLSTVENMLHPDRRLLSITAQGEGPGKGPGLHAIWRDTLELTELGRAVLRGDVDWMSLQPAARWVGGVHVGVRTPGWRWDEATREAVPI